MLLNRDRQSPLLAAIYGRLTALQDGQPTPAVPYIMATTWGKTEKAWVERAKVSIWQLPPENVAPPYVAIGCESKPWGSKTCPGDEFTVVFVAVSDYPGLKELSNIANSMLVQLTKAPLDLSASGLRVVLIRPGTQVTQTAPDGITTLRRISFRIIVEDIGETDPILGG